MVSSLCADVYVILDIRWTESESAPFELAEDMAMDDLFRPTSKPPLEQRVNSKRQRSLHTTEVGDEARAKEREREVRFRAS